MSKKVRNKSDLMLLSVTIALGLMLVGVSLLMYSRLRDLKSDIDNRTEVVSEWLGSFMEKGYQHCDTLIASDGYYISGFDNTTESLFNPVSEQVYYKYFDLLVDSISSIEIVSSTYNMETGYTDYNIEVKYRPYKTISELTVDADWVNALLDDFKNERISEDDFSSKIQEYCLELFTSSFEFENEELIVPVSLTLSEKDGKVYGSKAFIEGIIPNEMSENLRVYQSNLKSKLNYVFEAYSY